MFSFWHPTWGNINCRGGEKGLIELIIPPAAPGNRNKNRSRWSRSLPTFITPQREILSWLFRLWICFNLCCSCRYVSCSAGRGLTVIARPAACGVSVGFSLRPATVKAKCRGGGSLTWLQFFFLSLLLSVISITAGFHCVLCVWKKKKKNLMKNEE